MSQISRVEAKQCSLKDADLTHAGLQHAPCLVLSCPGHHGINRRLICLCPSVSLVEGHEQMSSLRTDSTQRQRHREVSHIKEVTSCDSATFEDQRLYSLKFLHLTERWFENTAFRMPAIRWAPLLGALFHLEADLHTAARATERPQYSPA